MPQWTVACEKNPRGLPETNGDARYTQDAPEGNRVPGAVNRVASLGVTWAAPRSPWSGQFQLRHFGPRDPI